MSFIFLVPLFGDLIKVYINTREEKTQANTIYAICKLLKRRIQNCTSYRYITMNVGDITILSLQFHSNGKPVRLCSAKSIYMCVIIITESLSFYNNVFYTHRGEYMMYMFIIRICLQFV